MNLRVAGTAYIKLGVLFLDKGCKLACVFEIIALRLAGYNIAAKSKYVFNAVFAEFAENCIYLLFCIAYAGQMCDRLYAVSVFNS